LRDLQFQALVHQQQRLQRAHQIAVARGDDFIDLRIHSVGHGARSDRYDADHYRVRIGAKFPSDFGANETAARGASCPQCSQQGAGSGGSSRACHPAVRLCETGCTPGTGQASARTDALVSRPETGKIGLRPPSPLRPVATRRAGGKCKKGDAVPMAIDYAIRVAVPSGSRSRSRAFLPLSSGPFRARAALTTPAPGVALAAMMIATRATRRWWRTS